MRILSLTRNYNSSPKVNQNPSFGYNATLNKELKTKIKKDNSQISHLIADLNETCNRTEDSIKTLETNKGNKSVISIMSNSLIVLKAQLSDLVETNFPDLNFSKRESKNYEKEGANYNDQMEDANDNWRYVLATELRLPPITKEQLESITEMAKAGKIKTIDIGPDGEPIALSIEDALMEISYSISSLVNLREQELCGGEPYDTAEAKGARGGENEIVEEFVPNDESPKGFSSIGGMDDLKAVLKDKILDTISNKNLATLDKDEYGKKIPKGFLFYGPPGCGKTFITEAVAVEAGLPLFKLKISKAGSMYINQTAVNYGKAFDEAAKKAKQTKKPVILFIDEIDGLCKDRDKDQDSDYLKQVGTLLDLIGTARSRNIIVFAATNKFDLVDDAIKRRLDTQILIDFPDTKAREAVLQKTLASRSKAQVLIKDGASIEQIAKMTDGFSNDDLCVISDTASDNARKDGRRDITLEDFKQAIETNKGRKLSREKYVPRKMQKSIGFPTAAVKGSN